ncbi:MULTISPECIES: hypothetical protein [unclassified Endozoicomonas]|uniref:hypothetical protein n=1 Tax=unclassified Endozoicomonas TaxID=2644528 RepID=UPI0021494E35|nr:MULTISPECIES: hypothetical protein [unclassified Endozoicomonas]
MSGNVVTREEFEELREEFKDETMDLRIRYNDISEWLKVRGVDVAAQRSALNIPTAQGFSLYWPVGLMFV